MYIGGVGVGFEIELIIYHLITIMAKTWINNLTTIRKRNIYNLDLKLLPSTRSEDLLGLKYYIVWPLY